MLCYFDIVFRIEIGKTECQGTLYANIRTFMECTHSFFTEILVCIVYMYLVHLHSLHNKQILENLIQITCPCFSHA